MENWIGLIIVVIIGVLIQVAIIRWIFRINPQIKLLTEIRDEVRYHNSVARRAREAQQS